MKRKTTAFLVLLLAVFQVFFALGESGGAIVATVGRFTVTSDQVRLFRLQDEAARVVAARFGLVPSAVALERLNSPTAEQYLLTMAAAAQSALDAGFSVTDDDARGRAVGELIEYPKGQGQEYFADYAGYVSGGFGGVVEDLLHAAVPLKKMELLADMGLRAALDGVLKDRTDDETVRILAEELAQVPCVRRDGAPFTPSWDWLFEKVFVLRGFR